MSEVSLKLAYHAGALATAEVETLKALDAVKCLGRRVDQYQTCLNDYIKLAEDYAALEAKAKAWERLARAWEGLSNQNHYSHASLVLAKQELTDASSDLRALGVEL